MERREIVDLFGETVVIEISESKAVRKPTRVIDKRKVKDIGGMKFGKLTAIRLDEENPSRHVKWVCQCECGVQKSIEGYHLRAGKSKSCGCAHGALKHGQSRAKSRSRAYMSWVAMKSRCYDTKHEAYGRYGGRGITVCDRWLESFENFYADMGDRPEGMSLDRFPNSDGNYEPGNCRWTTQIEQSRNRSGNHFVEVDGQTKTLAEWCAIYDQPYTRVRARLQRGWEPKTALQAKSYELGLTRGKRFDEKRERLLREEADRNG